MTTVPWTVIALTCAAVLTGCVREQAEEPPAGSVSPAAAVQLRAAWPAGLAEAIDSANSAYGEQDYERAAELFRRATLLAPEITSGWFGVYISEHARGNVAAADSAMERARSLQTGALQR